MAASRHSRQTSIVGRSDILAYWAESSDNKAGAQEII